MTDESQTEAVEPQDTALVETPQDKAPSIRDALDRAFERSEAKAPTEAAQDPAKPPAERVRDEQGKFAKADASASTQDAIKSLEPVKPEPTKRAAPARFKPDVAPFWEQTPEAVQAEIERSITELESGINKYKPAHERYERLKQFDESAQGAGIDLAEYIGNVSKFETDFQKNPLAGTLDLWRIKGIDPSAMVTALAQQVLGISSGQSEQQGGASDTPEVANLKRELAQLRQQFANEFGGTKQSLEKLQTEMQRKEQLSVIGQFADARDGSGNAAHPYFDDLAPAIARQLETGFAKDLQEAYDNAVRLTPEVAAKIEADRAPKEPQQPNQVHTQKKAALSISGAPSHGSNPSNSRKPAGTPREAIDRAFASHGL